MKFNFKFQLTFLGSCNSQAILNTNYLYYRYFITGTGNNSPIMQCCLEKSTIASSGTIIAIKDRISLRLLRRIIQGFSNIFRLVSVFLKRGTHSLKFNEMIYVTFSLCLLILLCVKHVCAGITYGIDGVKSSNSAFEDAFWSTVLRWRKVRVVLTRAAGKYTVKALQPDRWQSNQLIHTAGLYIDLFFFFYLFIFYLFFFFFASKPRMPLARFEPVRQRYVASREANRFTDWAIRAPGMG